MKIIDDSSSVDESNKQLFIIFYDFAKNKLKLSKDINSLCFVSDEENYKNPLGKTAYYEPSKQDVVVYVNGRHVKDMLRSFAHELVHHQQNCESRLNDIELEDGYAQKNPYMRGLEKEAYLYGNTMFRDWEDNYKKSTKVTNDFTTHLRNMNKINKTLLLESKSHVNKKQ